MHLLFCPRQGVGQGAGGVSSCFSAGDIPSSKQYYRRPVRLPLFDLFTVPLRTLADPRRPPFRLREIADRLHSIELSLEHVAPAAHFPPASTGSNRYEGIPTANPLQTVSETSNMGPDQLGQLPPDHLPDPVSRGLMQMRDAEHAFEL